MTSLPALVELSAPAQSAVEQGKRVRTRSSGLSPALSDSGTATLSGWQKLRQILLRWVRRWTRDLELAEEVVSEAITRAWERFRDVVGWRELRSWTAGTLRHIIADHWRARKRQRIDAAVSLDELPCSGGFRTNLDLADRIEQLQRRLTGGDRETLALLGAGIQHIERIAIARGLGVRAVQQSRARIANAAAEAWNYYPAVRFPAAAAIL